MLPPAVLAESCPRLDDDDDDVDDVVKVLRCINRAAACRPSPERRLKLNGRAL